MSALLEVQSKLPVSWASTSQISQTVVKRVPKATTVMSLRAQQILNLVIGAHIVLLQYRVLRFAQLELSMETIK